MSSCPGDAILRLLGTDAIGDTTFAAIEQHVESCSVCKSDLERLAKGALLRHDGRAYPDSKSSLNWAGARWEWFTWRSRRAWTVWSP